jgi:hypothetical protein
VLVGHLKALAVENVLEHQTDIGENLSKSYEGGENSFIANQQKT